MNLVIHDAQILNIDINIRNAINHCDPLPN